MRVCLLGRELSGETAGGISRVRQDSEVLVSMWTLAQMIPCQIHTVMRRVFEGGVGCIRPGISDKSSRSGEV